MTSRATTEERQLARDVIASARSLYVSGAGADIASLPAMLRESPPDNAIVTSLLTPNINTRSLADPEIGLRARTFFLNGAQKRHLAQGYIEYCPWRYSVIDRWMRAPGRFDTAIVMLSPPDRNGRCSLGVQADFLPTFYRDVARIVGIINPNLPHTFGDAQFPYAALSAVVEDESPLPTTVEKAGDEALKVIAQYIAELVPDGATVQFGVGQIPSQVMAKLSHHRRLRIHSGVVDDNILSLDASGALDRDHPIVTGTAIGSREFYRALDRNDRFQFRTVAHTHAYRTISAIHDFAAVNSVLQVDLTGQMSAEGASGRLIASPGGLPDFVRGAQDATRGQSLVAVRAEGQAGRSGGIVPLLDMPHTVTCPAPDADVVVTEFGIARIRELSFDRRAEALIAIAAPADREALLSDWKLLRAKLLPHT